MQVPNFTDLGKNARDIFKTDYHHGKGLTKFNFKTKSAKRFQMTSDATLNFEETKLNGLMETKYKANVGALLLQWTTEGALSLGYKRKGLLKGVDLLSECSYNPETAAKNVKIGSKFANERFNAYCEISNDLNSGTSLLGSMVMKCRGLFMGYQGGYDTAANRMASNDIGIAYDCPDIELYLRTSLPYVYALSVLYKVRPDLDFATNGIYARRGNVQKWTLGAAAKYRIDEKSTLRFKFNTDLQLATSLSQKLGDSVALILSFNIDCENILRGGHRVGLALNVEA